MSLIVKSPYNIFNTSAFKREFNNSKTLVSLKNHQINSVSIMRECRMIDRNISEDPEDIFTYVILKGLLFVISDERLEVFKPGETFTITNLLKSTLVFTDPSIGAEYITVSKNEKSKNEIYHDTIYREIIEKLKSVDNFDFPHSLRINHLSFITALKMGLSPSSLFDIRTSALFHNNSQLLDGTFLKTQYRCFEISRQFDEILSGKRNIESEDTCIEAKIIHVVDFFDHLTSNSQNQKAKTEKAAIKELKKLSGKIYDKEITGIIIDIIKKGINSPFQTLLT